MIIVISRTVSAWDFYTGKIKRDLYKNATTPEQSIFHGEKRKTKLKASHQKRF